MKPGISLEKLIQTLEKILCGKEDIKIESPKKLRHALTGKLREHDVVITITKGHHEIMTAIECRDRSRPVSQQHIEAFHEKCKWTGINKGVIVSVKGFYRNAITLAEKYGIRCLGIEEVASFNWLLAEGWVQHSWKIRHVNITMIPVEEQKENVDSFVLFSDEGVEVSKDILIANAKDVFDKLYFGKMELGIAKVTLPPFKGEGFYIKDNATGRLIPLKIIIAEIEYEHTVKTVPFKLYTYYDDKNKKKITDVAVSPVDAGALQGNMVITYSDEGGLITFVPGLERKGE